MYRMYRYEARIQFMLFRVQFWEKFEQLEKNMTVVLQVSDALKNSKSLKSLLCVSWIRHGQHDPVTLTLSAAYFGAGQLYERLESPGRCVWHAYLQYQQGKY